MYFVDVGQGDCSLICINNKNIIIDGGGSENSDFDVGKQVLLPYLLDRRINKIDYMIISHFDSDHIGGLFAIMEKLKVKNIFICKQGEESENYKKFKQIVKQKNIKVYVVGKGDKIEIEKDIYFDVLWPNKSNLIDENTLNNNSIVAKLNYKKFSVLFTGDIEETAENEILKTYQENLQILNSTILKVAHHGSKTSSTNELINVIKPKCVLIGVGKNNKFGHPNNDVIARFENLRRKNI